MKRKYWLSIRVNGLGAIVEYMPCDNLAEAINESTVGDIIKIYDEVTKETIYKEVTEKTLNNFSYRTLTVIKDWQPFKSQPERY